MGKKAKPTAAAKPEAPSLPVSESPRLDSLPVETPSVPAPGAATAEEKPAEVLGVLPSAGTSTETINQPENTTGLIDPAAESAPQPDTNQPTEPTPPDDPAHAGEGAAAPPALDLSSHPAIELAKRHKTGAGKPQDGAPRYYTPPPFDVFAKKK
jgi:hypothetical protein